MSDQSKPKGQGIVKPYLGFVDTNVLFKKPVSCLMAIISLLIPVFSLVQMIDAGLFKSGMGKLIAGGVLLLLVLFFAGIFGALIWWHRRITKNDGTQWYPNFRRFIQTLGEWLGTTIAIIVFLGILVVLLVLNKETYQIARLLPYYAPSLDFTTAIMGLIAGFVIIIATKILLFLLDPVIWLIKQIWALFVRVVLYFYRCVIKIAGTVEQNTPVWIGVIWLIAAAAAVTGLILLVKLFQFNYQIYFLAGISSLALSFILIGFLVIKRKQYDM